MDLSERWRRAALAEKQVQFTDAAGRVRVCWPSVVQYRYGGQEHVLPPPDAQPAGINVKDDALYRSLLATGWMQSPEHTGKG